MAAPEAGAPEYIELAIGGLSPLAPDRLALRDATSAWRHLPADTALLLPGQFVVLAPDTSLFRSWHRDLYPSRALPEHLIELRPWPALNNGGDSLALSLDGDQVERLGYTGLQIERGRSLERMQAMLPAHAASNWSLPLSGAGSPGLMNTVFRNDTTAPEIVGIEHMDSTTLRLYFSEPILPADLRTLHVRITGDGPSGLATLTELQAESDDFVVAHVQLPVPLTGRTVDVSGLRDPSGNEAMPSTHPVHVPPRRGDLLMTEIMLRGSQDFVEFMVHTDRHLTLRDVRISPSSGAPVAAAPLIAPVNHLVSPGRVLVIPVSLPSAGARIVLEAVRAVSTVIDSVRVDAPMEDVRFQSHTDRSLVRIGPGPTDWASSVSPPATPGSDTTAELRRIPASAPSAHALTLSEVMYDPLEDPSDGRPDQVEFLEWTNRSPDPVSLFGAFMTWEISERGTSDTLRLGYQPVSIPPGGSIVALQLDSHHDGTENPAQLLQAIWAETPSETFTLPVRGSLGLLNAGRSITLHARDHTLLAHDTYSPDDHHPAVITGKGRALVRLLTASGFAPWTTSTEPCGASPGRVERVEDRGGNTPLAAEVDRSRPFAELAPRSFYPEHPELGGRTLIHVHVPVIDGPRVVRVEVRDLHAHVVRVLSRGLLVQGTETLAWDGRRDDGSLLPSGPYVIQISIRERSFRLPVALLRR